MCIRDRIKPVEPARLTEAIARVTEKIRLKTNADQYHVLMESMSSRSHRKIVIPELNQKRILNIADIIAIEGMRAYSKVYLKNDKPFVVSKNLKYFENLLQDSQLIRAHKSWIINQKEVTTYKSGVGEVQLTNGVAAKVAKSKLAELGLS